MALSGCFESSEPQVQQGINLQQNAINLIKNYASSHGTSKAPSATDYANAGVNLNGVNVDDINAYIATLDTSKVDSQEKIQQIADDVGVWLVDTDGDGTPDYADLDDDGDGVSDADEIAAGTDPLDANDNPMKQLFVFQVKTDNLGTTEDNEYMFFVPTDGFDYNIDCDSDGIDEATHQSENYKCIYEQAGEYNITISGEYPGLMFNSWDPEKLLSIEQWGTQKWATAHAAFRDCIHMVINAKDKPNLENVSSLAGMFAHAAAFNNDISDWNVSSITNMQEMFLGATAFNQDLNGWDVSHVETMDSMFRGAENFDGNISDWNVTHVKDMEGLFYRALAFNQDIGTWQTDAATNMRYMFYSANTFNQDLSSWNTSNVKNMEYMFRLAHSFTNHDLSRWQVTNVTNHLNFGDLWGTGNTEPIWP